MRLDALLDDDRRALAEEVRAFCAALPDEQRRPDAPDGRDDGHRSEVAAAMAARGWWGDRPLTDVEVIAEEAARGIAPIAGYWATYITAAAIRRFGTEEQRRTLLGPVDARGEVLAIAITEPGAGSDMAAVACRARRDGDGWVLDGEKRWCSFAHRAGTTVVLCRTGPEERGHAGLTTLLVPRDAPGVTVTPLPTVAGGATNALRFEDVRLGPDALLGEEGQGWAQVVSGLNLERVLVGAVALGLAQRAFDDALAYAGEREQFGRRIGSFQAQRHRFAQLATELTQARLLVRWVAQLADEDPDRPLPQEASMAKLAASELAKRCALESAQAMGANGLSPERPTEAVLRGTLATTVFGGTSDIQRELVGRTLGL